MTRMEKRFGIKPFTQYTGHVSEMIRVVTSEIPELGKADLQSIVNAWVEFCDGVYGGFMEADEGIIIDEFREWLCQEELRATIATNDTMEDF